MSIPFTPPEFSQGSFNCPRCGAFSAQEWLYFRNLFGDHRFKREANDWAMSHCVHCKGVATWYVERMVIPDVVGAPQPHVDKPETVRADFEEARSVLQRSPRSAAALLRLSLQRLCKEVGEKGENINNDIASLVAKGLPVQVQQALDIIRVVGNEQVHPGELDVKRQSRDCGRTLPSNQLHSR